ncbi:MAG: oxygen-dependent coproporphyrinogen oxidase [Deltaproteobacteria bacterium]|nr:oxygen-dependent coproporphyrinogen oxidase [Deltaproteobacteria bacterium]
MGRSLRARARAVVEGLQDAITGALEAVDGGARFREDLWSRAAGGGGRSRVLEGGRVFEKAGVNVSAVWGEVPRAVASTMPGEGPSFFATGVSLVLHPLSPQVPTTHANFRYIERGSFAADGTAAGDVEHTGWFGGGADLTPYLLYEDDARHFHVTLKAACDTGGAHFYPRYKAWCDEYFRNTHRDEGRGVGGIFFDWLRPGVAEAGERDLEALFGFWERVGASFLPAYLPIVERRRDAPWTEEDRRWQLERRGRYVEFNLLHDRGTKFGLQTGGRVESILMSLPPLVRWDYAAPEPAPGTPGARLLEVLRRPVDWV